MIINVDAQRTGNNTLIWSDLTKLATWLVYNQLSFEIYLFIDNNTNTLYFKVYMEISSHKNILNFNVYTVL